MGGVSCGELSLMLFVFNGGFTKQPNPVQYTFDHKCGWGVGKLCRGGPVALF